MEKFLGLLDVYNRATVQERAEVEKRIWRGYGKQAAPLVLDMSGFSFQTRKHGILHYLAMVRLMQATTRPIVEAAGGQVIKYEADNMFALFPKVRPAIETALHINAAFADANTRADESRHIHVSIGIAWGELLHIPGHDYYGDCLNLASKLGEDVAERGEILVDHHAFEQIDDGTGLRVEPANYTVSGLEIRAVRVLRP